MQGLLEQLNLDHRNVAQLLDLIRRQADQSVTEQQPDQRLNQKILLYLTQYQDLFHHPKEDLVFDALRKKEPSVDADVTALEQEHQLLYSLGANCTDRLFNESDTDPDTTATALFEYVDLLERHMIRESKQIFPLAQIILRPNDWSNVDSALHTEQDPLFGPKVEAAYRGILETLGQKDN